MLMLRIKVSYCIHMHLLSPHTHLYLNFSGLETSGKVYKLGLKHVLGNFTMSFSLKMTKKFVRVNLNPRHNFLRLIGTIWTYFRAQKYFKRDI